METQSRPGGAEPSRRGSRWVVRGLIGFGVFCLLAGFALAGVVGYFYASLPSFNSLDDYHPPQVTRMVDRNGEVVAEWYEEKRTVIPFGRIPPHAISAFLSAEDAEFYRHKGLDFPGMLRALVHNVLAGRVKEGGSTITQQVLKTFLLGPKRSFSRKIREVLLARRLEVNLTKEEILSLYLNQIYFGNHCYGVQEASRFYFGKDVEKIGVDEAALLASLPKSPALYSPIRHPDRALERRNWVLDQMQKNGRLSEEEWRQARANPLAVAASVPNFLKLAPYYAEHCRRLLEERLGRDAVLRDGLRVELAVDARLQQSAQAMVSEGLREVDKKQGYRGPLGRIDPGQLRALHEKVDARLPRPGAVWSLDFPLPETPSQPLSVSWKEREAGARLVVPVIGFEGSGRQARALLDLGSGSATLSLLDMPWARKITAEGKVLSPNSLRSVTEVLAQNDVIEVLFEDAGKQGLRLRLDQLPLVQGALVAIDPTNRHVLALVGGSDFHYSSLIRAIQSRRQPGSAFKPILYTAAIQTRAYTPASLVMDTPEVFRSSTAGSAWKPQNFERAFLGPVTLRYALAHSINTVAVKIASDIGLDAIIATAKAIGIESKLEPNLSLALGTSEVTLLELVNAYTTFAAGGLTAPPVFIRAVYRPNGEKIFEDSSTPQSAISEAEAFVVTSLLRSVIQEGTGQHAQALQRPAAGKTGTTDQQRDAWFVGFTPSMVSGVWVGFDDHRRLGGAWAQGAGTALPIWTRFMTQAMQDVPVSDFVAPPGVVFVRLDPQPGVLGGSALEGAARFEVFVEGTEPQNSAEAVSPQDWKGVSSGATPQGPAGSPGRLPEGLFR